MRTWGEDLLLLVTDDRGRHHLAYADLTLAATYASELAASERIGLQDKRIQVVDASPTGDDLLDLALERFAAQEGQRPVIAFQKVRRDLTDQTYRRLVRAELVTPQEDKLLGLRVRTLYLPVEPHARRRLQDELVPVLSGLVEPDARTGALIALVRATGGLARVFPAEVRGLLSASQVRSVAKEISRDRWPSVELERQIASLTTASMVALNPD